VLINRTDRNLMTKHMSFSSAMTDSALWPVPIRIKHFLSTIYILLFKIPTFPLKFLFLVTYLAHCFSLQGSCQEMSMHSIHGISVQLLGKTLNISNSSYVNRQFYTCSTDCTGFVTTKNNKQNIKFSFL
jgi:hypothetical protein